MKAISPVIVCSFVVLLSASTCYGQGYFRSSARSWNSSYNSATDKAPQTTYSHADSGWVRSPMLQFQMPTDLFDDFGPNQSFQSFHGFQVPMLKAPESMLRSLESSTLIPVGRNQFSFSNVAIGQVFLEAASLSNQKIGLTREAWKKIQESSKTISVRISNVSAKQLMETVLKDLGLAVTRKDETIVISIDSDADKASEYFQLEELVKLSFRNSFDSMKQTPVFMSPFDISSKWRFGFPFAGVFSR